MKNFALLLPFTIFHLLQSKPLKQKNWPNCRGPNFNGSPTDAENLPTAWSNTENIIWKTPMPGASAATPIIWDDHVFLVRSMTLPYNFMRFVSIKKMAKFFGRKRLGLLMESNVGITKPRHHQSQMENTFILSLWYRRSRLF